MNPDLLPDSTLPAFDETQDAALRERRRHWACEVGRRLYGSAWRTTLAERLQVSPSLVHHWAAARKAPSVRVLDRLYTELVEIERQAQLALRAAPRGRGRPGLDEFPGASDPGAAYSDGLDWMRREATTNGDRLPSSAPLGQHRSDSVL